MELNITHFFNTAEPRYYSASQAELGPDAGRITWENARDSGYNLLDTDDKREAARQHFALYGAWTEEEIAAWSDVELTAITIQDISAAMRDSGMDQASWDWAEYERQAEAGQVSGALFQGISGEVYFYMGE